MIKRLTLLAFMMGAILCYGQLSLPIDFESTTITYTFTDFDGGQATVIPNPQSSGINTSGNVAQMVKNAGQVWGGSLLTMPGPIDFSTNRIFKVKVFSPNAGTRLLLKVENAANGGISYEKEDTVTTANTWEELTFDFNGINQANQYSKIVFIFDLGIMGDGSANFSFLFDDIQLVSGGSTVNYPDLPVTFEDTAIDYNLVDFGGNASMLTADPDGSMNTVVRSVKTSGAQTWAGTTIGGSVGFATPVPFTATETKMTVRVYAPNAGIPIRLKVEDATNAGISVETEAMTTVANAWETLEFDFSNPAAGTASLNLANTYDKASMFFYFGTDGAGIGADSVYYWDDVEFVEGSGLAQIDLPVTFDDETVDYTLTDFGGNASYLTLDPAGSSDTVVISIKTAGAETWAGTTMGGPAGFANPIPFTASETKMTVQVYAPNAGIPIRLKVEDATNAGISVETEAMTTVANAWETLEFDFSNEAMGTAALNLANTYDKASIFFYFGTNGAGVGADSVFFWDDVEFLSAPPLNQPDLPVTFEDTTVDYNLTDFGGNASMLTTDPDGGTNTVARSVKTSGAEVWAGTTIGGAAGLANAVPFSAIETKMTVRVYAPNAGIPIRLKVEDATNAGISVETEAMTTVA
ncbi:MAG: hypothetical protein KDD99_12320, partial [Bacteroidetes bacterium]|nr:hypothetical protein [Bacteroidota bacterium]